MSKIYNDNDFTDDVAMLKKQKDSDSKKYEKEVQDILEKFYGYKFVDRPKEIKEYDMEAITGEKIEVKSDYGILQSKKLFVEIWDNLTKKEVGWLRYCTADILAVVYVDEKLLAPMKISFFDFKAVRRYILTTYYNGDWTNTEKIYKDEYGERFVFALKDRPYLKYMLIELHNLKPFDAVNNFVYET
ncbi:hypothetical protein [Ruminiclostridium josui]|uniref:hypothetical protein n=2 Tax=Ruminiclostridium josui TaxID=1499 RepID=UPI0004668F5C|nr:hypothetical protein [Ruminiclostridium josui]